MGESPQHPVGYRPGKRQGGQQPDESRGFDHVGFLRLRKAVFVLVFLPFTLVWFGIMAVLFVEGEDGMQSRIDGLMRLLGATDPGEPPSSLELESSGVIEGDVQVLTFEQVRARSVEDALSLAIEKYPEKLRELLEVEHVDPNLRLPHSQGDGWTHPLEKAVRQGTPETFRILLDAGADVNGAGSDGGTALHRAAWEGSLETVDELLRRGADPDRLAVPHDHAERAQQLGRELEPPAGSAAVELAAGRGHREVVARLLAAGASPRYALLSAGSSGDVALIELLLERGADPRAVTGYDESMLRHAATEGHVAAVRRLLAAGARPREMALRGAAQNGHDDVIRAFAEVGARFDGPPGYWDPLYTAAHAGHASTVALLLELGASTAAAEGQDRPIDAARAEGHTEVVAILEGH